MISVILYAAISIALAAAAGFALLSIFQTTTTLQYSQETASRLDIAAAVLRLSVVSANGDGLPNVPMGEPYLSDAEGYLALPANLGVPITTANGIPFRYCPFGPVAGGSTNLHGQDEDYLVEVSDGSALLGSQPYVVASDRDFATILRNLVTHPAVAESLLALVIAPAGEVSEPPPCADVTIADRTRNFAVTDGSVRAITGNFGLAESLNAAAGRMTLFVDDNPTGSAPWGLTPDDPMPLQEALQLWASFKPRVLELRLMSVGNNSEDSYDISGSSVISGSSLNWEDARLYIRPNDDAGTSNIQIGAGRFDVPGHLVLERIALTDADGNPAGTLRVSAGQTVGLRGVAVDELLVRGGRVTIHGAGNTFGTVIIDGGEVLLSPDAEVTVETRVTIRHGRLLLSGHGTDAAILTLAHSANPGIRLDHGSHLIALENARLIRQVVPSGADTGAVVEVAGNSMLALDNARLIEGGGTDIDRAVRLRDGGTLHMAGSSASIGTSVAPVTTGIEDLGGGGVFGNNSAAIYATTCVDGPLNDRRQIDPDDFLDGIGDLGTGSWLETLGTGGTTLDGLDFAGGSVSSSFWQARRDEANLSHQCGIETLNASFTESEVNDNFTCLQAWVEAVANTTLQLHRYALHSTGADEAELLADWCSN